MAANLLIGISRKSITVDEAVHIPAGYFYLVSGDFRINNEHPPLVKMWAALPLLLVQPNEPNPAVTADEDFRERTWGFHKSFWELNAQRFLTVSFWPRVMMVPLTLTLGLLIFVVARRLFGVSAALVSLSLYVLEPTMLAHGRIVHTDVPAALTYILFFFTLYQYHLQSDSKRAWLLGIASALALLTKFSMIVFLPVLAVYFLYRILASRSRSQLVWHAAAISFIILLLVNIAYRFQHPPLDQSDVRWATQQTPAFAGLITASLRVVSKIIPTYYLFGFYNVEIHNYYGHAGSLLGQYGQRGWWYYFPLAFALKTTIPFLLLTIAAVVWIFWRCAKRRDARYIFLSLPILIYLAIALTSHINIGIRHLLPVYPFLFIAGGALLAELLRYRKPVGVVLLVLMFSWMSFEAGRAFPNYLPYMNQLASGHPHWYYLADSNVEWGEDIGALAAYLHARGETSISAALQGQDYLQYYGVAYIDLAQQAPDATPETRYVAIGASALNGATNAVGDINGAPATPEQRVNFFAPYRDRQPEAVIGGSIYVFRMKQ